MNNYNLRAASQTPNSIQPNVYPGRGTINYPHKPSKAKKSVSIPCGLLFLLTICCVIAIFFFFLFPANTTILFLGIDYAPHKSFVGRSDTIVLMTFNTIKPYAGFLSIPRDLWVPIPGVGENRINTAHFFAEAQQAGTGPSATIQTIKSNFGVSPDYYIRIRFDGVREIVNSMGGVDITLNEPLGGYSPGSYHLSGEKALGFARRRQGADDFYRMRQGQLLIRSIMKQLILPRNWLKIPLVLKTIYSVTDTNIPLWRLPQVIFALIRTGFDNIDSRIIDRDMVTPFTTDQGASVLLPRWEIITPLVQDMFDIKP